MNTTSKIAFSAIMASAVALSSQAGLIEGAISFGGNVNAYTGTSLPSSGASDYASAHTLVLGSGSVTAAPQGVFLTANGGINPPPSVPVSFSAPQIQINTGNPFLVVPPAGTPMWSVTTSLGSTFSFYLSSLQEVLGAYNPITHSVDTLTLLGAGTISDDNGVADNLQDNPNASWVATFTVSSIGNGLNSFSWSSSFAAISETNVPETGTSVILLGLGLAAMAGYSQFRKQVA